MISEGILCSFDMIDSIIIFMYILIRELKRRTNKEYINTITAIFVSN